MHTKESITRVILNRVENQIFESKNAIEQMFGMLINFGVQTP
jgi:hypothetical protein